MKPEAFAVAGIHPSAREPLGAHLVGGTRSQHQPGELRGAEEDGDGGWVFVESGLAFGGF